MLGFGKLFAFGVTALVVFSLIVVVALVGYGVFLRGFVTCRATGVLGLVLAFLRIWLLGDVFFWRLCSRLWCTSGTRRLFAFRYGFFLLFQLENDVPLSLAEPLDDALFSGRVSVFSAETGVGVFMLIVLR